MLDAIRDHHRETLSQIDHPLARAILSDEFDGLEIDEQWDHSRTVVTDGTASVVFEGGGALLYSPDSLLSLVDAIKAGIIPLSDSLPDFGGEEPDCTSGVWSWDETHLMTGMCVGDLGIVSREQHEEEILQQHAEAMYEDRELADKAEWS